MSIESSDRPGTLMPAEPRWWWLVAFIALVAALWGGLGYYASTRGTQADAGQFGDMFGAVNALFTGLAFAALIYTILLQRYELALQRSELTLTRAELRGQKEQLAAHHNTMQLQRFENSFFELLKLLGDTVQHLDGVPESTFHGQSLLHYFDNRFRSVAHAAGGWDDITRFRTQWRSSFRNHEVQLGPYFRLLYCILSLIDRGEDIDKEHYLTVLRARLSPYELILIFYQVVADAGPKGLGPLVEKYALLADIPREAPGPEPMHRAWLKSSAYGEV